jgi:molybdopterin/thiamine biosynthesis adenylyltransferase/SAM-dependent methyltransferase
MSNTQSQKEFDKGHFTLAPYLSVRRLGESVAVGCLPPHAIRLEGDPKVTESLLCAFQGPQTIDSLVDTTMSHLDISSDEARSFVQDLISLKVLVKNPDVQDRYSRHRLYYQMLGFQGDPQDRLKNATVGLIGMGGIGTHVALHLAAAGVGQLVISDGDAVELSNLTRQTLFTESDCGRLKVDAAEQHLREVDGKIKIKKIASQFTGGAMALEIFSQCDFVVLSADRPAMVHDWAGKASLVTSTPFSNVGYIESFGVVGPAIIPGVTRCYSCIRGDAEQLSGQHIENARKGTHRVEINAKFQAPSFGPLNAIAASIQANEVIRHLLGLPLSTKERRLLLSSQSYETLWEEFSGAESLCDCCTKVKLAEEGRKEGQWSQIAQQYAAERDLLSCNALVVDPWISTNFSDLKNTSVADIGAGNGKVARLLAEAGAVVTALEPHDEMFDLLRSNCATWSNLEITPYMGSFQELKKFPQFDKIFILNVLDHVEDFEGALRMSAGALKNGGELVLSLPHPMKDFAGWTKVSQADGSFHYKDLVVQDYLQEGPCIKNREDHLGNRIARGIRTYHRTSATYVSCLLKLGFRITAFDEPGVLASVPEGGELVASKLNKIPYFLLVRATHEAR